MYNLGTTTGFGYEFNALNPSGEVNPLSQALNEILGSAGGTSIVGAMAGLVPGFQYLVSALPPRHLVVPH